MVRVTADALETEFVCIPWPLERADDPGRRPAGLPGDASRAAVARGGGAAAHPARRRGRAACVDRAYRLAALLVPAPSSRHQISTGPESFTVTGKPWRSTALPAATRTQPSEAQYSSTSLALAALEADADAAAAAPPCRNAGWADCWRGGRAGGVSRPSAMPVLRLAIQAFDQLLQHVERHRAVLQHHGVEIADVEAVRRARRGRGRAARGS